MFSCEGGIDGEHAPSGRRRRCQGKMTVASDLGLGTEYYWGPSMLKDDDNIHVRHFCRSVMRSLIGMSARESVRWRMWSTRLEGGTRRSLTTRNTCGLTLLQWNMDTCSLTDHWWQVKNFFARSSSGLSGPNSLSSSTWDTLGSGSEVYKYKFYCQSFIHVIALTKTTKSKLETTCSPW